MKTFAYTISGRDGSAEEGLRVGDAVDFRRVERCEKDSLLRLRAETRLPGRAWLQFETMPRDGGRTDLRQTAFFEPHGAFIYLYW